MQNPEMVPLLGIASHAIDTRGRQDASSVTRRQIFYPFPRIPFLGLRVERSAAIVLQAWRAKQIQPKNLAIATWQPWPRCRRPFGRRDDRCSIKQIPLPTQNAYRVSSCEITSVLKGAPRYDVHSEGEAKS